MLEHGKWQGARRSGDSSRKGGIKAVARPSQSFAPGSPSLRRRRVRVQEQGRQLGPLLSRSVLQCVFTKHVWPPIHTCMYHDWGLPSPSTEPSGKNPRGLTVPPSVPRASTHGSRQAHSSPEVWVEVSSPGAPTNKSPLLSWETAAAQFQLQTQNMQPSRRLFFHNDSDGRWTAPGHTGQWLLPGSADRAAKWPRPAQEHPSVAAAAPMFGPSW